MSHINLNFTYLLTYIVTNTTCGSEALLGSESHYVLQAAENSAVFNQAGFEAGQ